MSKSQFPINNQNHNVQLGLKSLGFDWLLVIKVWEFIKQNKIGLGVIFATWLIFFSRIIFGGQVYFLDDLKIIFYPLENAYASFEQSWRLPVWSNLFGFGHPLLAWGQLGFFTPLHLVLRLFHFHPLILLQISVTAYYAFGALGMYLFLRGQKLRSEAAALGALVFTFAGFNIGHLNHVNFYTATMLLPWLLLTIMTFFARPSLRRATALSIFAAAIVLSGQPQVVLYTFLIAFIFSLLLLIERLQVIRAARDSSFSWLGKIILFGLFSVALAAALSSFALLPLKEFLPITERSDALPEEELFEFSYPPSHAITLVLPSFYGTKDNYWGAKNYQELAGFVGIIPLLLVGPALLSWRRQRNLRITAIVLIAIAVIAGLGYYSPPYRYLVQHKILTSLAVPGRFVFLFDVAIALLASVGLHDLIELSRANSKRLRLTVASAAVLFILFTPFSLSLQSYPRAYHRLSELIYLVHPELFLTILGLLVFFAGIWIYPFTTRPFYRSTLLLISALTLLIYGWNYNPLMSRTAALTPSPFTKFLQDYARSTHLPPRVYASEYLVPVRSAKPPRRTNTLSSRFSAVQPFVATHADLSCLEFPVNVEEETGGLVHLAIHDRLDIPPLREATFTSGDLKNVGSQRFCFPPLPESANKTYLVSFTTEADSGLSLSFEPTKEEPLFASFIGTSHPSPEQVTQARKPIQIILNGVYASIPDSESTVLVRHLQATAEASAPRWIGALSIRSYREFIENFFANDSDPINGDGQHVLLSNRAVTNLASITHVIAVAPKGQDDLFHQANFGLLASADLGDNEARLYLNPEASPKAFLIHDAQFLPSDDEVRNAMHHNQDKLGRLVYVDGPTPPQHLAPFTNRRAEGTATITKYESTQVDVDVDTPEETWLVVTDTTTDNWHTYIDNQESPHYDAYTIFKAAQVPAGKHTVSFHYYSPAIEKAKIFTLIGVIGAFVGLLLPTRIGKLLTK
jgi:hypothetical protein